MSQHDALAGSAAGSELSFAYVVADNPVRGEAIAAALREASFEVRVFASVTHLLARLDGLATGCIVSGSCVPTADGILLLSELAERGCHFPVVMLTPAGDVATAVQAMKAGAADVVPMPLQPDALARAVTEAMAARLLPGGGAAIPEGARLRLSRLTRRERQVLDAIIRGDGNKAIAHDLGISPRTVEVHRAKVMEKLSCRSVADVIRFAAEAGLLRP